MEETLIYAGNKCIFRIDGMDSNNNPLKMKASFLPTEDENKIEMIKRKTRERFNLFARRV